MKVKANSRVEGIFAHAVAMDNRGMKNMVHCIGSFIYIVNFDHSMILRFSLRQSEVSFDSPISFNANEYDSPEFAFTEDESGGKIVFHMASKEYKRRKICRADRSGPDAKAIATAYRQLRLAGGESDHVFYISENCVPLLEEGLSHTEISVEDSALILRQRNVYTGTIIEVEPARGPGFFQEGKLPDRMAPIALKTKDFMSLFTMRKTLAFVPAEDFVMVRDDRRGDFEGALALCKYDMVIDMYAKGGDEDGGKEQKARSGEQAADRPDKGRKLQRKPGEKKTVVRSR